MSDKKTLTERIKANLETIKKLVFAGDPIQTTTADGVNFFTDGELAVGAKPYTKDDAGNVQPLPAAKYTLQDGSILDVQLDPADASGVNTIVTALESPTSTDEGMSDEEMKKVAEAMSAAVATQMTETVTVAMKAHTDKVDALTQSVSKLTDIANALTESNKALSEKYESEKATSLAFKKEVLALVETIAEKPAEDSSEKNKKIQFSNRKSERDQITDLVNNYVNNIKPS